MRDGYAEVVDPKSGVVGGVQDVYGEDTATEDQPVTPGLSLLLEEVEVGRLERAKSPVGVLFFGWLAVFRCFLFGAAGAGVGLLLFGFSVLCGYSLLRDPHHNKGLAFNEKERDSHCLGGLLLPTVVSQELQVSFFLSALSLFQSLGLSDL
ncbi:hypothetical protein Q3G72_014538 [Acer saccharum]|nr:hypothetical protein Q3G72_014538 [Acer saccharum]